MNEQIASKLWIIKFCLKLGYPKFNYYTFMVFCAIKYRLWWQNNIKNIKRMDIFEINTIPQNICKSLIKDKAEDKLPVVIDKCIVISKEQYIQLSCENLFYVDNGMLWIALKLSDKSKTKFKDEMNIKDYEKLIRNKFNYLPIEVQKKLWPRKISSFDHLRIVPVIGSKMVCENNALMSETELYNIASSFGLLNKDVEVSFQTIPSLNFTPTIAARAEVSLVVNDYDLPNDYIKEILSNYFETPKVLSVNDIFSITLTPDKTAKYHYKHLDLVNSAGKLYFVCTSLTSSSENLDTNSAPSAIIDKVILAFFVVKGVTQMSLGEHTHLLKPKDQYIQPQKNVCQRRLNIMNLCPTGLKQKFNQIQEAINPFLTGEINELSLSLTSPILPLLLLTGTVGSGKHLLVKVVAKYNGMNCLLIDCNAIQSSTAKQTESKINSVIQKAKASAPTIILLDNFEVFAVDPENNEDCRIMEHFMNSITDLFVNYTKHPIIFIAVTEKQDLKPNILRIFLDKFHIRRLNSQQRYEMLEWFATVMQLKINGEEVKTDDEISLDTGLSELSKEVLKRVAAKTETFLYGDIDTLMHFALRESYLQQHRSNNPLPSDPDLHLVTEEDFNKALESIRNLQSQHLDAPKIPKVYWDDIGGLESLKKELLKTIEFPIKYPHLFKSSSLKRSGILLYGPPGCGKTLVAKAVSTELNVSFLSVKGPELLNMYVGQSEENVRKVFESARASSPCIVFLDELDALAPRRGAAGDSGGASDRLVSQLLAEIDGVTCGEEADTSSFVFIMGATNRPELLERSLLRPGRLDKLVYVGPYCGAAEKTRVLTALCRKYKVRAELQLGAVAEALPERVTGADLLGVVSAARGAALRALIRKLHAGAVKESELSPDSVILGVSEFLEGVEAFRPSVTDEELAYYESMKSQM